jgi:hypothetical protein
VTEVDDSAHHIVVVATLPTTFGRNLGSAVAAGVLLAR